MFRLTTLLKTSRLVNHVASVRHRYTLPYNTCAVFVPNQEAWVIERMGKFHSILEPGLNFLIPFFDRIQYVQSLKEIAIEIPKQSAVTSDNVSHLFARHTAVAIDTRFSGLLVDRWSFVSPNYGSLQSILWCRRSRIRYHSVGTDNDALRIG